MKNPLVSVVVTTYNRPDMLAHAVNSVLHQTFKDFELIIVDDASTHPDEDFFSKMAENGSVHVLRHEKNKGLAAARNTGVSHARGEFIAFLDDDDEWYPDRLAKQVPGALQSAPNTALFYCGKSVYRSDGAMVDTYPTKKGNLLEALLNGFGPPPSTMFLKKEVLLRVGCFDESLVSCIDHDCWFTFAVNGYGFDCVPLPLVLCNPHAHTSERMTTNVQKRIIGIRQFLKKWESTIVENRGTQFYRIFYRNYLGNSYGVLGQTFVCNGFRKKGMCLYLRSLAYMPFCLRTWFLLFCSPTFGMRGLFFFVSLWNRISNKNKEGIPTTDKY